MANTQWHVAGTAETKCGDGEMVISPVEALRQPENATCYDDPSALESLHDAGHAESKTEEPMLPSQEADSTIAVSKAVTELGPCAPPIGSHHQDGSSTQFEALHGSIYEMHVTTEQQQSTQIEALQQSTQIEALHQSTQIEALQESIYKMHATNEQQQALLQDSINKMHAANEQQQAHLFALLDAKIDAFMTATSQRLDAIDKVVGEHDERLK